MYEMSCNWGVGVTRVFIYLDEWVLTARSCYCSRRPQDNLNWACTCLRLAQPFCLNLSSPCLDASHNTFGSLWFGTDGVFYRAAQRRSFLSLLSQPSLMTGRIGIRGNKWTAVYSRQSGALGADAVSIYTFMSTCFLLNLLTDCFTLFFVFSQKLLFYSCLYRSLPLARRGWNDLYPLPVSRRPAPVVPSERKRKWCHATTIALRGTTGHPGSGETSVLLASTMEEPIIAVPLPLSTATTVRGSFPSQSSPPFFQLQLQLPWQHRAAT